MPKCPDEKDVSEILPKLWLGNAQAAMSKDFINKYGIKRIINITKEVPCLFSEVKYMHLQLDDLDTCQRDLNNLYDRTTDFIYDSLKNREPILVHCKMGHHRSASVVCAFLFRYLNIDYIDAVSYINSIRHCALVRNTCMMNGLFGYYITLIHSREKQNCKCEYCNCK